MIQSKSKTFEPRLDHLPESKIIFSLLRYAYHNGYALAYWKLPGEKHKHLVIDTGRKSEQARVDLEQSPGGFLVAPFENPGRSNEQFLKADIYYCSDQHQLVTSDALAPVETERLINQLSSETLLGQSEPKLYFKGDLVESTTCDQYQLMVERALQQIAHGKLQKVVPAAIRSVSMNESFSYLETFNILCSSYPQAFVSMVSTPDLGTWLGASPEAIIEIEQGKIFSTVAVAGTQRYDNNISLQEVAWRQKEIEEQALVSRYIINCFKKIRLREFIELGPKTVVAGNLLHLKTTYSVDMDETNFPLLGSVMLDLLHPTSAVCGMPKPPALSFIEENEQFNRELFSGYLGPVNMHDETHLFVNLRCMKILNGKALLFAGAGITEDSIPEKEWMETQLKCDTLLDVMNQ